MRVLTFAAAIVGLCSASIRDKLIFSETFDDEDVFSSGKWVKSSNEKYRDQPVMIKPAIGAPPELSDDKGVELTQEMKFYGFGAEFAEPIVVKDSDFVVQYEVKVEHFQCGGAYVKLLRSGDNFSMENLDNNSPYTIMFGPDRCGSNNKVHFILQHQSPITQEWEEKHFEDAPAAKVDKNTHLYTLVVRKDNSFEMYIDKELQSKGNLLSSMTPSVNPPATIDDPTDHKPADWVDEAKIPDPEATKPEDWDETQPAMIPDPDAKKPEGWLDDAPLQIPDPEADRPEDWDDDEDGEWEAPVVPNPACEAAGCGPWSPPKIHNPLYKGKWSAPMIDNPDYIGEWQPKQIPNPNFFEDLRPADMAPMAGIAVEVWTTNSGIHFDNFAIASSLEDAFAYADETFVVKETAEKAADVRAKEEARKRSREEKLAEGGFTNIVSVYAAEAIEFLAQQPPAAIAGTVVVLLATLYFLLPSKTQERAQAPSSESESKEEVKASEAEDESSKAEDSDEDDEDEKTSRSASKRKTRKAD
mmetsp:Transcript_20906/g.30105  ORF Transcript_20906/g.30105 Transcript_20906/m.30105 type:complete len:528 (+) Transcript_20906:89-1672(+)